MHVLVLAAPTDNLIVAAPAALLVAEHAHSATHVDLLLFLLLLLLLRSLGGEAKHAGQGKVWCGVVWCVWCGVGWGGVGRCQLGGVVWCGVYGVVWGGVGRCQLGGVVCDAVRSAVASRVAHKSEFALMSMFC